MDEAKIAAVVDDIIDREGRGKFTNRKADRGGPSFEGITWKTYNAWLRKQGKPALTQDEFATIGRCAAKDPRHALRRHVREIYRETYVDPFKALPRGLREMTIDAGVLSGWPRAARWAQQVVDAPQDGVIGPITLRRARDVWRTAGERRKALVDFADLRLDFYIALARRKPQQMANLRGWKNRTMAVLAETLEMYR